MSGLRIHRGAVKPRKAIPEGMRRREGAHRFVRTKYEPEVCGDCRGKGYVYDVVNKRCPACEGEGEI